MTLFTCVDATAYASISCAVMQNYYFLRSDENAARADLTKMLLFSAFAGPICGLCFRTVRAKSFHQITKRNCYYLS